jgi:hypothetical protein
MSHSFDPETDLHLSPDAEVLCIPSFDTFENKSWKDQQV